MSKSYHEDLYEDIKEYEKYKTHDMKHKCKRMKNKRKIKNMLRWVNDVH